MRRFPTPYLSFTYGRDFFRKLLLGRVQEEEPETPAPTEEEEPETPAPTEEEEPETPAPVAELEETPAPTEEAAPETPSPEVSCASEMGTG